MLRPITTAPMFSCAARRTSSLTPVSPPSPMSCPLLKLASLKIHSWRPPASSPSGFASLWFGPAMYPSSETAICALVFGMTASPTPGSAGLLVDGQLGQRFGLEPSVGDRQGGVHRDG